MKWIPQEYGSAHIDAISSKLQRPGCHGGLTEFNTGEMRQAEVVNEADVEEPKKS